MKLILTFIILLLNYIFINSSQVQFNNLEIQNCLDISNPCDLSSSKYWINSIVPTNGDDVLIDFSSESQSSSIYLIAENFHLELSSFIINGQYIDAAPDATFYNTSLNIENSNLTIGNFNASFSNVNFNQNSENYKVSIGNFNSTNSLLVFHGLIQASFNSFVINGPNALTIKDNSSFIVNDSASFNSPIHHTSSDLFKLSGFSTITNQFNSNGTVLCDITSIININGGSSLFNELYLNTSSFTISGDQVIVQISTLTTESNSHITLTQKSNLFILDSINSIYLLNDQVLITEKSTLYLPSGYTIYDIFKNTNGTISILDSKSMTSFQNCFPDYLYIIGKGNITVESCSIQTVSMSPLNPNSGLTIQGGVVIKTIFAINNYLVINEYSKLTTTGESNILNTYINGVLINQDVFYSDNVYIAQSGSISSYSNIIGNIIDYNSIYQINAPLTVSSLYIYFGGQLTMNTNGPLLVENNLTIEHDSNVFLYSPELNSKVPQFNIGQILNIGEGVSFNIIFNSTDIKPKDKDTILLFKTQNNPANSFSSPDITVKLLIIDISKNFNFKLITSDSGDYSIQFNSKGGNDGGNDGGGNDGNGTHSLSKGKIAAAIVVPCFVVIVIIVIVIKVKRNSNSQERKPLI